MSKEREITFALPVKDDAKALLDYSKKVGSETDFLSFGPEGLKYSVAKKAISPGIPSCGHSNGQSNKGSHRNENRIDIDL